MQNEDDIVIENRWNLWSRIALKSGTDEVVAQIAVQNAGRRIRERLGLRNEPFRFRSSTAGTEFQAVGVAGTLSLKEISFEVVPKFVFRPERLADWSTSTLFLLEALAGKHVISLLADRQKWRSHRVPDLIAHAFADAAERGLRDQPIHVYRQIEESAPVMRGRLNVSRQLRNVLHAPHLLECDVDQLDAENPFNDVLKWAAFILARTASEQELRQRLTRVAQALPGRPERSLAHRHLRLIPPPQFQAWGDALELARLLASGMTMSTSGGHGSGYSLLFNMERAFERFVEVSLSGTLQTICNGEITSNRQEWTLYAMPMYGGGKPLGCRPDNVLRRNGHPIMVVDAKYKLLDDELRDPTINGNASAPKSSDVHELLTAMLASRCSAGLLVYPSSSKPSPDDSMVRSWMIDVYGTKVRIGAIPIHLLSLHSRVELANAHSKLAGQIAAFAEESTRLLELNASTAPER